MNVPLPVVPAPAYVAGPAGLLEPKKTRPFFLSEWRVGRIIGAAEVSCCL